MAVETVASTNRRLVPALLERSRVLLPGVLLSVALALAALTIAGVEEALFGRAWLDAPVLAILAGSIFRLFHVPGGILISGISFSARMVLEIAIVLLGATLSAAALISVGPALLAGIAAVVGLSLAASYGIASALGLPKRVAALIACGNSICGNSAIMAAAPIIGAKSQEVASAVAFTALVGVVVVAILPILGIFLELSEARYGILAGLTVYAVPQVLAATAPIGAVAIQLGTIVKLARVVMLGPVCLALAMLAPRFQDSAAPAQRPPLRVILPWFVIGFLAMAILRSVGLIPEIIIPALGETSKALTIVSLAALGLGVDLRAAIRSGPRVVAAAVASVAFLGLLATGLLSILNV